MSDCCHQTIVVAEPACTLRVVESGPPGPPGPPGSSGSGTAAFVFTQSIAATVWTVNHNLGVWPETELFDVGGNVIDADIHHTSLNQTVITFVLAVAGQARFT